MSEDQPNSGLWALIAAAGAALMSVWIFRGDRTTIGRRGTFLLGMLAALALLLVVPVPAVKLVFGVVLIGLAVAYALYEERTNQQHESPTVSSARLEELRRLYARRARRVHARALQRQLEQLSPLCRPYYERLLQTEDSIHALMNAGALREAQTGTLLDQVHTLGHQIGIWLEQLRLAEQLLSFYEPEAQETAMVIQARDRLTERIEGALAELEGVPARLLQLSTASSQRGTTRLVDDLRRMSDELEGRAAAYQQMTDDPELSHLYARLDMETDEQDPPSDLDGDDDDEDGSDQEAEA